MRREKSDVIRVNQVGDIMRKDLCVPVFWNVEASRNFFFSFAPTSLLSLYRCSIYGTMLCNFISQAIAHTLTLTLFVISNGLNCLKFSLTSTVRAAFNV